MPFRRAATSFRHTRQATRRALLSMGGAWSDFADWFNGLGFSENTILLGSLRAVDLAEPVEAVTPADSLLEAVRRMGVRGTDTVPVVDGPLPRARPARPRARPLRTAPRGRRRRPGGYRLARRARRV